VELSESLQEAGWHGGSNGWIDVADVRRERLPGGWNGTISVERHIPLRESCDMKSSQLVPLIN
jgi:hypothetical protein